MKEMDLKFNKIVFVSSRYDVFEFRICYLIEFMFTSTYLK